MIHTSCSKPLGPGLVSGSFEVISGESRNGGVLCSPQNGDGGKDCCEGKITNLTLQNGGDTGFITVKQKNGDVVFAKNVDHLGAYFRLSALIKELWAPRSVSLLMVVLKPRSIPVVHN